MHHPQTCRFMRLPRFVGGKRDVLAKAKAKFSSTHRLTGKIHTATISQMAMAIWINARSAASTFDTSSSPQWMRHLKPVLAFCLSWLCWHCVIVVTFCCYYAQSCCTPQHVLQYAVVQAVDTYLGVHSTAAECIEECGLASACTSDEQNHWREI